LAANRKKRASENAHIVLIDETGLQLSPLRRRTWAKRGSRPILKDICSSRKKISIVGALTISAKTQRRNLYFQSLIDGTYNSDRIAAFLRELLKQIPGKIIVVWDNGPMHKGLAVRELLKKTTRLTLENLPPYAPELNPVEQMWSHLKYGHCANQMVSNLFELDEIADDFMISTKHTKRYLKSYWHETPLVTALRNESK
jgi:hypothetical protein